MRYSLIHLLVAVTLCILSLEKVTAQRRRTRCYVRLCYKCGMYINTRGKRSIVDGENELDSPEDGVTDELEVFYKRKPKNLRWTDRNSRQMDAMLRADLPDEFDTATDHVPVRFEPVVEEGIDKTPTKSKGRHRKRSVDSHIGRCIHILKSRCCRMYSVATYIGYRLKN